MYILNVSLSLTIVRRVISSFIKSSTREKIEIFSDNKPKELLVDIYPSQLLATYRGNYEQPAKAWPPEFPPQTYRDEYRTKHFTNDRKAVPSPGLTVEMKGLLKDKWVTKKPYLLSENG